MNDEWFTVLLATTAAVRGMGAGMIVGVSLMTLPVRHRLGTVAFARFMRAHYREPGVRAYATTTIVGAILTLVVVWVAIGSEDAAMPWLVASFAATILGFVGTAMAFPTMRRLWATADEDEALLAGLLDRFARWGNFSAAWHSVAFIGLIAAMVASGSP